MNGTDRVRNPAKVRELTVEDTEIVRVWRAITADAVISIPLVHQKKPSGHLWLLKTQKIEKG